MLDTVFLVLLAAVCSREHAVLVCNSQRPGWWLCEIVGLGVPDFSPPLGEAGIQQHLTTSPAILLLYQRTLTCGAHPRAAFFHPGIGEASVV